MKGLFSQAFRIQQPASSACLSPALWPCNVPPLWVLKRNRLEFCIKFRGKQYTEKQECALPIGDGAGEIPLDRHTWGAKPGRGPEERQGAGRRTGGEDQGVRSLGRDADGRMSRAYLHEPKS